MNRRQRGVLVGMSLGDGYLAKQDGSYSLRIEHSTKQLEYLQHKANLIHSIFGGKTLTIYRRKRLDKRTGNVYSQCSIAKGNKYFKYLRKRLYKDKVKTITKQVLEYLTPEGLAIFYMDDGACKLYKSKKTGKISSCQTYLATYCPREEAEIFVDFLKERHGIEFKIYERQNGQCELCANTQNSKKFVALVRPYIIPSMQYKVRHVPQELTHEC